MRIADALKIASARINSKVTAREILKFDRKFNDTDLILNLDKELDENSKFWEFIEKFQNGKPLAYITNEVEFFGEIFFVDESVLIPRFETEILVNKSLEILKNFKAPKILEIGTGSGIISIMLKKNIKDAEILAVDISKKALKTAIKNAKFHGVEIDFKISDLFENVEGNFDLVVSNPPYIAQDYPLDDYVLKEPETALIGGKNGSEILINLINQSTNRTKFLACEIGYDQKEILKKELVKNGFKAQFYKDLAGFDRGFTAKK